MDIDSSNFDAKRYVLSMLKDNTIKQLIRRNNEIDEEIKTHDHEIQSLVFQNYSKFISSIDTVRQMKDNICMVDDKLKVLQTSMDNISQLALKIDSTFAVKRKEIQKLDTINKDLQKLKNLCEFPNVLKQDIVYYKGLSEGKIVGEVEGLFNKSVQSYQACYKTLLELKDEPLIAPIYKESVDKVETMRSTLKALQVQFNKNKAHSSVLRNITRKLLLITDDQVSILRIYLHSWKERFGEACFKGEKRNSLGLVLPESGKKTMAELFQYEMPEINEDLWKQFTAEFNFIYKEVYPKLTISPEEIQLHIAGNMRDIFLWALNHYAEAVPNYCTSLKGYVQVNHFISQSIRNALLRMQEGIREDNKEAQKVYLDLKTKMQEKFETLGVTMLNFVFGRLKLYFLLEVIDAKKVCESMPVSEESSKDFYAKGLTPLKQTLNTNFKLILDDMEHIKNSYEHIFSSQIKYEEVIHKQIEELLRYLAVVVSKPSGLFSEELCSLINTSYALKFSKSEKALIDSTVKELLEVGQSGGWYVVSNSYLNSLASNISRKIIDGTQKTVQIPKNHDYGKVFAFGKICLSKNLLVMGDYFAGRVLECQKFEQMIGPIQDFVEILNIIFSDSKRSIIKKPSFLSEENAAVHETEILSVKKMHLIDRKNPTQRSAILAYFVRKLLKVLLIRLRRRTTKVAEADIYCLIQICYELSNVEEEGQICAFYQLLLQQIQSRTTKGELDQKYSTTRKLLRTQNIFN